MDYQEFCYSLLDTEPAIFGVAVVNNAGNIAYQTENWNLSEDLAQLRSTATEALKSDGKNPGSMSIMRIKYMIVEFTPERVVGTNVSRKGHIILAPVEKGALISFIDPNKGPRDALFNVQNFTQKLKGNL